MVILAAILTLKINNNNLQVVTMVTVVAMVTVKSNNNNLHIKVTSPVFSIRKEE